MTISPIWEQVHSTRDWFSVPQEQLVMWVGGQYGGALPEQRKKIKILDIGCGQGPSTLYIAAQGFHVVAVDGSISALTKLGANLAVHNLTNVDIIHCDMAKLPCEDNYFDAVVDVASICMNYDCQEIFDEVARVLKPEGLLFSVLAATDTSKTLWEKTGPVSYFDPDKIRDCLAKDFKLKLYYKCVEAEDKSDRLSHWVVIGRRDNEGVHL